MEVACTGISAWPVSSAANTHTTSTPPPSLHYQNQNRTIPAPLPPARRAHQGRHHGPGHRCRCGAEERDSTPGAGLCGRGAAQVGWHALARALLGKPRDGLLLQSLALHAAPRTTPCTWPPCTSPYGVLRSRRRALLLGGRVEPNPPAAALPAPPCSQEDIANRRSMADARAAERAFFESHPEYLEVSSQVARHARQSSPPPARRAWPAWLPCCRAMLIAGRVPPGCCVSPSSAVPAACALYLLLPT